MTESLQNNEFSPYNPYKRFTSISKFPPDDTFEEWKHPAYWSKEEIHDLVMREVGEDNTSPRGFYLLTKLWTPPAQTEGGVLRPEHEQKKQMIQCTIAKILRMGGDSFTDIGKFPSGPLVTYGEWGVFRGNERQPIGVGEHRLALIADDRFMCITRNPDKLKTSFELELEWANH